MNNTIQLDGELPEKESVGMLFTEMDFYQATQLYLWSLPLVTFAEWQRVHEEIFGAKSGDLVTYRGYEDVSGIITANATTPYTIGFINLEETGPMVVEIPKGHIAGGFSDFWQRELAIVGEMGPDGGKGGKYIVFPPGMDYDDTYATEGYYPFSSSMFHLFFGLRALDPDPSVCKTLIKEVKIYPYAERKAKPTTHIISPAGKKYFAGPPKGLLYWKTLQRMIRSEPVEERDRFFVAQLDNLGMHKESDFHPTAYQEELLMMAVGKGEFMAKANAFRKRFADVRHWPEKQWDYVMVMPTSSQRATDFDYFFERASYFYEAVTFSEAMVSKTPNVGQAYLGSYTDQNGEWLSGANTYKLHMPPNPPAANFWSITVYDIATRCLIQNEERRADITSRQELAWNADGSIDIYFGPDKPAEHSSNWVQTNNEEHWFVYLRLYGPMEAYFDKSWIMDDITLLAKEALVL
ncbi:DUF1254 domain-containing protein [Listeria booriae]|uniref:DUF1254 domain-containing protein n=1 Tax=Listeria booriae TaxID=1552123 RepID=A0A099W1T3_9LIST|nr:DUF1254 domain-containing protein [Listeria booriae]KGL37955.1 hypothetical protein EP57_15470 [Listeria booriae]STY45953.1 Uncharacterized conserved protein [Listeria booriae]